MKIGIFGLLGIIFVTLKLCGVITWSWLWVTSPFWIGILLWIVVVFCMVTIGIVVTNRRW